jgi:hypothetical protein
LNVVEFARIPFVLGILANPTTPEISVEDAHGGLIRQNPSGS